MKKFLLFALMAVVLGACSTNNPDSKSGYIQKVQLSDEQIAEFKAIFNNTNELLKAYPNAVTVAILSTEELRAICPSTAICPQVDFSKQCIIFAPIELSSINDEIIDNAFADKQKHKVGGTVGIKHDGEEQERVVSEFLRCDEIGYQEDRQKKEKENVAAEYHKLFLFKVGY